MKYFRNIFKERSEISVRYDAENEAIWCYLNPNDRPRYSIQMLESMLNVQKEVIAYFHHSDVTELHPVKYWIYASQSKDIYNYGGDLENFADLIVNKERDTLLKYAKTCIEIVYLCGVNFNLPLTTISLVQGTALGGGFESILSTTVSIVEKRSRMGFPEIRFNMFPGMGAYSFLARHHGIRLAEEMITSGKIYSAQELYDKGIITELVDDGTGIESVKKFMKRHSRYANGMQGIQKIQQRYKPLSYDELMDITEIWVDTALNITDNDIKTMHRLVQAQNMKDINHNKIRTVQDRRISSSTTQYPLVDVKGNKINHDRRKNRDRRIGA